VVEWVRLPLVPVTVTVKVPVAVAPPCPVNVNVDVPLPPEATVTLVGLRVAVTPAGSAPVDSDTVPLKPFSDVMVMVVDADPDLVIVRLEGDELMLKSPVT
jgi:hypothetical protein